MNDALALVFDVGTQSVRAMLFDAAGHIVRSAQDIYEYPYYSRNPNWAEQRPDFYFEHICIVSQRLKDQSPEDFARAASVAVTVFRDTTVCMGKDGRPLHPLDGSAPRRKPEAAPGRTQGDLRARRYDGDR